MKETEPKVKEPQEVLKQAEIKSTEKYLGSLRLLKGQTLFEVNKKTLEIKEARFEEKEALPLFVKGVKRDYSPVRTKLIVNEDCYYVAALNKKNVIKKIKKGWQQN